jgi:CheY-like chemotaxis protein
MKKILVCEDNDVMAELMAALVAEAGHSVVHVEDGRKAVAAAVAENADLVVMDLRLPGEMDGLAAARALRAKGFKKPIVMVTASSDPEDRERATEAGCDAFIDKKVLVTSLKVTLARLLKD